MVHSAPKTGSQLQASEASFAIQRVSFSFFGGLHGPITTIYWRESVHMQAMLCEASKRLQDNSCHPTLL